MLDLNGTEPFLLAALFSAASIIPLTLTKEPSPNLHEQSGYSLKSLFKQSPFGFTGCLISGVILSSIYSFAPLFAKVHNLSVGGIMGSCILGGVLLQWPVGKLSDIFDRRRVLFTLTIITALQAALLVFVDPQSILIYFLVFVLGGLVFTLYPISITQVCDRVQPQGLTKATGMLLLAYGIGAVVGPVAAPVFVNFSESYGLFLFVLISTALLAIVGLLSFRRAAPVPEEMQSEFVSLPRATPIAYELDPRIEDGMEEVVE